ncbi:hypothetical protein FRB95_014321 [Tulasnella sp. JGI-2019a]|nr:hypothetical protein FRB93_002720 [Tulasnella sp. JGI-2019a]KAG9038772.1 hypothetical protein FRB95_014321 [Tulasnella sp. JGI-2019a]
MPRIPTAFEHSNSRHSAQYHSHHDSHRPHSYHQPSMHSPHSRFSPAPTYSSSYASSSSPCSSPPPPTRMMLSPPHPNATMRTAKSGDFTTPGGVYPYQKGKKVTNAQLTHLLDYFAQHDNPSPARRIEIANKLEMYVVFSLPFWSFCSKSFLLTLTTRLSIAILQVSESCWYLVPE